MTSTETIASECDKRTLKLWIITIGDPLSIILETLAETESDAWTRYVSEIYGDETAYCEGLARIVNAKSRGIRAAQVELRLLNPEFQFAGVR